MAVLRNTHVIYKVQPGDTLYSIASRFGSTVSEIERVNFLYPPITDPSLIYPGWTLLVPIPAQPTFQTIYITAPGDTMWEISQRFSSHVDLILGVNRQVQDPNRLYIGQSLWVPAFIYEVETSDSLFTISTEFKIPMANILNANADRPGLSLDLLYPGFRLVLPLPSSRNIVVTNPFPGDMIRSQVQVEGFARVFEANVLFQIIDDNGVVVSNERYTTALEGAPAFGYFSERLPFDRTPTTSTGELWVYSRSPEDGRIVDLVRVPVKFGSNVEQYQ